MDPKNPNESAGNRPELAVILVVGGQRERAGRALNSLIGQSAIDRMEILLFDLGPEHCHPLPNSNHARVGLTRLGPNELLAIARARGIRSAKSPIVCFMEEHCEMQPGWAEAVIADHQEPWAAVGSDFINANPDAGASNKAFRINYGHYVRPPGPRGPTRLIAGQNSSFKRDILLRYESDLDLLLNAELILQRKMQDDGYRMFYNPSIHIAHRNENTFQSLATGAFYWNWCYSNVRAQIYKWGPVRKLIWIALSPLIPWVRLLRLFRQEVSNRCHPLRQFFADIPFIIGISYCGAAGQVAGLLNKIDHAASKFSHFEMNEPRLAATEMAG